MFDFNMDGKEDGLDYLIMEEILKEEEEEKKEKENNR